MAGQTPPGPGVDATGQTVQDPTPNVLDLVEAAIQRQDDLRNADMKRQDDLRESESRHLREVLSIRSDFLGELRHAESLRIDAIRAVDVGAVNRAAEVSAIQASTLAAQVATSAETLRAQVAAAASAGVTGLAAALEPMQKDIGELRKSQYELAGQRANVVETRTDSRGGTLVVIAVASAVIAFISVAATVVIALARG